MMAHREKTLGYIVAWQELPQRWYRTKRCLYAAGLAATVFPTRAGAERAVASSIKRHPTWKASEYRVLRLVAP